MKITVVIPLYNKKLSILNSINSVLAQTIIPDEILIINDGSNDGSEKLVEEYNHVLVKLVHQKNAGVSAARNKGIEVAQNEWIAFLDADDLWDKDYIKTINFLNSNYPDASVLATNYNYKSHDGKFNTTTLNKIGFEKHGYLNNYFEVASFSSPPLWSSAVVIKKNALKEIGGFPLGITSGEDLLTWAKLAYKFKISFSKSPMATFVLDPAHTYEDKPNRIPEIPDLVGEELKYLYSKNKLSIGLKQYIGHWHKMRASDLLRLGIKWSCFKEILNSLRYHIYQPKLWVYFFLLFLPSSITNKIFQLKVKND